MVRVSNGIITLINVLTFVISLTAIGLSLWFGLNSHTHCHKILQKPLLFVGLALSIVSLLGLFGSCSRLSSFMWIYLIILFLLIVGLVAFTVFTIVVTNKHIGKALSEKRIGEHRLGDYSRWLQTYVINAENWDEIKNFLVDVNLCRHLTANKGEEEFFMRNLSLIQVFNRLRLFLSHRIECFLISSIKCFNLVVSDICILVLITKPCSSLFLYHRIVCTFVLFIICFHVYFYLIVHAYYMNSRAWDRM